MTFILCLLFLAFAAAGTWLRFDRLDIPPDHPDPGARGMYRPMHLDEAVQAIKFQDLLEKGDYVYDPHDYHGPILLYATLPLAWLQGQNTIQEVTEWTLRAVPALFGVGLIFVLLLAIRPLGWLPIAASAAMLAISPSLVYYSRYYIMEIPMVFFLAVAFALLWRYSQKPTAWVAAAFGAVGGLVHATKETGALSYFAMFLAMAILISIRWKRSPSSLPSGVQWKHTLWLIVAGMVVSTLSFSVFFKNPSAIVDSVETYFRYFGRAEGSGHDKPWDYYFRLLAFNQENGVGPIWSEWLILVFGAIGMIGTFTPLIHRVGNANSYRFLALYTVILATLYALIPYKTPWSMLSWTFTLTLLAGAGVALLLQLTRPWFIVPIITLAVFGFGLQNHRAQAERGIFPFQADPRNPYVYGHTVSNLLRLVERVEELCQLHPEGKNIPISIYNEDWGWPLSWYFRSYTNVAYYDRLPDSLRKADVIIASYSMDADLEPRIIETHDFDTLYGLRDDLKLVVYIEKGLWEAFLDTR